MKRSISIAVGSVAGLVILLALVKYLQISGAIAANANAKPPPTAVTSVKAERKKWPEMLAAIGSLVPIQGVTLSAEGAGDVTKINFDSGNIVQAGDVIIELDSTVEEAQLKAARARREQAHATFLREQVLINSKATSKANFEAAEATFRAADAEVHSLQAQIDRKKIVAPFQGKLGIRLVNLGQYLLPGAPVIPLHDIRNLYVNFSVPQAKSARVTLGDIVELRVGGQEDRLFQGKISAIDPQVDEKMRTIGVQATVPNPDETLRPGMFAHVTVFLGEVEEFITIPLSGVQFAPYGDTVFVIEQKTTEEEEKPMLTVREQVVKLGKRRGEQVAVLAGLDDGVEIVSSGTFKLRPGAEVMVNNTLMPGNNPNPTPEDS